MKISSIFVLLIFTFLLLLPTACNKGVTETTKTATETTKTATETQAMFTPPSAEELAKNNFALPEIPRILCEELKQVIDNGDDISLIDARSNATFKLGFITGSVNIPEDDAAHSFTPEWVNSQLQALPTNRLTIFYCD